MSARIRSGPEAETSSAVTVAPRFTLTLTGEKQPWALGEAWGDGELPLPASGTYRNVFTGEEHKAGRNKALKLREVLREFPLALLVRV